MILTLCNYDTDLITFNPDAAHMHVKLDNTNYDQANRCSKAPLLEFSNVLKQC